MLEPLGQKTFIASTNRMTHFERAHIVRLISSIAAYGFILVITFFCTKDWNRTGSMAVFLTGAVVIWYTWETNLLRSEARKQNELAITPIVVFTLDTDFSSPRESWKMPAIRNVGFGPAFNVRVGNIVNGDYQAMFFIDDNLMLEPKQEVSLNPHTTMKGETGGFARDIMLFASLLSTDWKDLKKEYVSIPVTISYEAANGDKYTSKQHIVYCYPSKRTKVAFESWSKT